MKIIIIAALVFFTSVVNATTPSSVTRANTWTLSGTERLSDNHGGFHVSPVNIPNFQTEALCKAGIVTIQKRQYPATENSLIPFAGSQFVGECHLVKIVVPVLNVVVP